MKYRSPIWLEPEATLFKKKMAYRLGTALYTAGTDRIHVPIELSQLSDELQLSIEGGASSVEKGLKLFA